MHAHATENEASVRAALSPLVPRDDAGADPVITTALDGDAGNRIVVMSYLATTRRDVDRFIDALASTLPLDHKQLLGRHFTTFFNPATRSFSIRLDKQAMHRGLARLSRDDDVVHVSIKLAMYRKQDPAADGDTAGMATELRARGIIA